MVVALVILTVVAFVIAEAVMIRAEARQAALRQIPRRDGAPVPAGAPAAEPSHLPTGVFVDGGHTWVRLAENGIATIGLDEFLTGLVGRFDRVELPADGTFVERGESLVVIRQGDREAAVRAPVSGTVVSSNAQWIVEKGDLVRDPYGAGWLCAIEPRGLSAALRGLRIAEEARAWIGAELARFRDFLLRRGGNTALGAVSPDGGVPVRGVLQDVDRETWDGFVSEFLRRA